MKFNLLGTPPLVFFSPFPQLDDFRGAGSNGIVVVEKNILITLGYHSRLLKYAVMEVLLNSCVASHGPILLSTDLIANS